VSKTEGGAEVWLEGPAALELRRALGERPSAERLEPVFYIAMATGGTPVAMLARLRWDGQSAVLIPTAPLTRGRAYRAVFEGPRFGSQHQRLTVQFTIPRDSQPSPARVLAVYPSQAVVPANLLKFYFHFSAPMREGTLFQHIRLLDSSGKPIDRAFNELELWSADHRRLTVLVHPGRTKQSLGLSEALGPVLYENQKYSIEVMAGLPDEKGRPLPQTFRHSFSTGAFDRAQPSMRDWKITPPRPGSRAPLRVEFSEALDHALALRKLTVEASSGRLVDGETTVSEDCRAWEFTPARPWPAGAYDLVAAGELEDLAGNNLLRTFEVDVGKGPRPVPTPPTFRRRFSVRP
jgi:hypothetical protein